MFQINPLHPRYQPIDYVAMDQELEGEEQHWSDARQQEWAARAQQQEWHSQQETQESWDYPQQQAHEQEGQFNGGEQYTPEAQDWATPHPQEQHRHGWSALQEHQPQVYE